MTDAAGMALVELLRTGVASAERMEKTERLLVKMNRTARSAFAYYLTKELDQLGKTAEVEKYWRRSLILDYHDTPCI